MNRGLILTFALCVAIFFGNWHHSFYAGMFMFGFIMSLAVIKTVE